MWPGVEGQISAAGGWGEEEEVVVVAAKEAPPLKSVPRVLGSVKVSR